MVIVKINLNNLRNAEHFQYIDGACSIFDKYKIDLENLETSYTELKFLRDAEEKALAVEKTNEKIREKNEADDYRDKLHSKLFSYVKSITYDEKDERYDDAVKIMKIIREEGNPAQLAENAESAMLTTLTNRLTAHYSEVEAIGAVKMVTELIDANKRFIVLEKECRGVSAEIQLNKSPSASVVRKQIDPVYRRIVNAINGYAGLPAKKDTYRNVVAEMNTLVAKYQDLISGRGGKTEDEKS
jgi:hypothetical protein